MFVWYFTFVVGIVIALVCYCCKCYSSPSVREWAESSRYEQHDSVAIDCEMVACVPKEECIKNARRKPKKDEVKVAVHCAIVDYSSEVIYNKLICLPKTVEDRSDCFNYIEDCQPFDEARANILSLLTGKIVVAHDFYHDFDALQICNDIPREKVRDTYRCDLLHEKAKGDFTLKGLARDILGRNIQRKRPHDPVEDATAAMDLYKEVEQEWEEKLLLD